MKAPWDVIGGRFSQFRQENTTYQSGNNTCSDTPRQTGRAGQLYDAGHHLQTGNSLWTNDVEFLCHDLVPLEPGPRPRPRFQPRRTTPSDTSYGHGIHVRNMIQPPPLPPPPSMTHSAALSANIGSIRFPSELVRRSRHLVG